MVSNRILEIKDAIEASRQRLSLIQQGILSDSDADLLPRSRAPKVQVRTPKQNFARKSRSISFHIPATRSHRLTSATGATSFHFSHSRVSKVTFATCQEGLRVKPGAARAHGKYIERVDAVACLEGATKPEGAGKALPGTPANLLPNSLNQEHRQHDHTYEQQSDPWLGRGLVDEFPPSEPGPSGPPFAGPALGRPVEDALTDAGMWLLPRRHVVRDGSRTHGLLRSSADVSLETRADPLGLRQPSQGDRREGTRIDTPSLRAVGEAASHDYYIGRLGAVAIQPDGTQALLTNIDADAGERALYWSSVEQIEPVGRGDAMTLRVADNPDFWFAAAAHKDCPPELKTTIETTAADKTVKFEIASGEEMRAFLATQPGWVPPAKKGKAKNEAFAKFHDSRSGRTQYRIVGELPAELDAAGRFRIMSEFCQEFTKRGLPFVAAMHAPDEKNDERNWHFHIDYHDRPCRRITAADIVKLSSDGYRTKDLQPGMWDFTVVTPKKGRTNGKAVPLTQNKVREVTEDPWIPMLRKRLAEITNRHLAMGGVRRRLDPRRYEEMGIVADPQAHLGTNQAAAETRGEATRVGCENERLQWEAIMAQGDARLEAALLRIDEEVQAETVMESCGAGDQARRREQLAEAARLDHLAFCLEQEIDRARSRAAAVRRKNQQLLDVYHADPAAGTAREREEAGHLVQAATIYLAKLDEALGDDLLLPAQARAVAVQALAGDTTMGAGELRGERKEPPARSPDQGDSGSSNAGRPNTEWQPTDKSANRQLTQNEAARQAQIVAALQRGGR